MARRPNRRPLRRPIDLHKPAAGHYRIKVGRVWLGAFVYEIPAHDPDSRRAMDRTPALACTVDGEDVDLMRLWRDGRLHPITEREYHHLRRESAAVPDKDTPLRESRVRL